MTKRRYPRADSGAMKKRVKSSRQGKALKKARKPKTPPKVVRVVKRVVSKPGAKPQKRPVAKKSRPALSRKHQEVRKPRRTTAVDRKAKARAWELEAKRIKREERRQEKLREEKRLAKAEERRKRVKAQNLSNARKADWEKRRQKKAAAEAERVAAEAERAAKAERERQRALAEREAKKKRDVLDAEVERVVAEREAEKARRRKEAQQGLFGPEEQFDVHSEVAEKIRENWDSILDDLQKKGELPAPPPVEREIDTRLRLGRSVGFVFTRGEGEEGIGLMLSEEVIPDIIQVVREASQKLEKFFADAGQEPAYTWLGVLTAAGYGANIMPYGVRMLTTTDLDLQQVQTRGEITSGICGTPESMLERLTESLMKLVESEQIFVTILHGTVDAGDFKDEKEVAEWDNRLRKQRRKDRIELHREAVREAKREDRRARRAKKGPRS